MRIMNGKTVQMHRTSMKIFYLSKVIKVIIMCIRPDLEASKVYCGQKFDRKNKLLIVTSTKNNRL